MGKHPHLPREGVFRQAKSAKLRERTDRSPFGFVVARPRKGRLTRSKIRLSRRVWLPHLPPGAIAIVVAESLSKADTC